MRASKFETYLRLRRMIDTAQPWSSFIEVTDEVRRIIEYGMDVNIVGAELPPRDFLNRVVCPLCKERLKAAYPEGNFYTKEGLHLVCKECREKIIQFIRDSMGKADHTFRVLQKLLEAERN